MDTLTAMPTTPDTATVTTGLAAPGLSPGQTAFIAAIQDQVTQFLNTKLDGPFQAFNYPSGFHKILKTGNFNYYNLGMLQDIDKQIDSGLPLRLDPTQTFSSLYAQLMSEATFKFSKADAELMATEEGDAQQAVGAVLDAFTSEVEPFPAGTVNPFSYVNTWMKANADSSGNLPPMYGELQNAWEDYNGKMINSTRLHQQQTAATTRLTAAVNNIKAPSATNGGMQTGPSTWYPGYTLPDGEDLSNALETATNAVHLQLAISNFSSSSSQLSIGGSAALELPIADIIDINASGSANYNASKYSSSDAAMTIDINYPGVTTFSVAPMILSDDNTTGWYDPEIVKQLAENTGNDVTGYTMLSPAFPIDQWFGTGKTFAHMRTFVLSQQPTVTMSISGSNSSQASTDLSANMSLEVDILGMFSIGGASGSYQAQTVDSASQQGAVTVTFGPTPDGSDPAGQVAFVMGGVVSYPPVA
jgi:hypothetical protein